MTVLRLLVVLLPVLFCGPAWAVQPDEVLRDPKLEARARSLSEELRCLVCQNQSIDDSAAPLARDLRLLVRERLEAGDSDKEVKRYLVERYGDFILLKPPFDGQTALLWIMPVVVLGGAVLVILLNRRQGRAAPPPPLSAAEAEQLGRVLEREGSRPGMQDRLS